MTKLQGRNLVNQILRMRFTQPLNFGFPTAEVLHQRNENIAPSTTFFGLTEIVHGGTFKFDLGV